MMRLHKWFATGALAICLALALATLSTSIGDHGGQPVRASHDTPTAASPGEDVAFDMILDAEDGAAPGSCADLIDNGGDTTTDAADPDCTTNDSNSIGAVDPCVSTLDVGSTVTFDVVLDGIISGTNLAGFNYEIQPLPADSLPGL